MRALRALLSIAAFAALAAFAGTACAAPPPLTPNNAPMVRVLRAPPPVPDNSFTVLSYHEVRDDVRDHADAYAVDSGALVAQFAWLKGEGWNPVSLQQIIDSRSGGKALPPKAVLLTFDDGYLSFYTRVYPLLQAYHYPALMAVVGHWIQNPAAQGGQGFGEDANVKDETFPSWGQIREMVNSGLVEVASHTYDLHHGVLANPQGNQEPAATTHLYDPATGYETDAQWRARVRDDMQKNSDLIERETGQRPRAMVWPYGSYGKQLIGIAGELGMPVCITLDDGLNTPQVPLTAVRRLLVTHNPPLLAFTGDMTGVQLPQPVRAVEVSLDQVVDDDPARQEQKLSALLDRVQALGATHVFLHAFTDDGSLHAYFPTRGTAVRADLFNRVAWQLATRTDVDVYAALPPELLHAPAAAAVLGDLARNSSFEGLYFMPFGTAAADVEESARLTAAALQWRAPLRLARGTTQAAPAQIAALSAGADFVVLNEKDALPAGAGMLAGITSSAGGGSPAAPMAPVVAGQPRLLVLFDGRGADGGQLAAHMRALQRQGISNFGYREGDFMHDQPPLATVAPALSVRDSIR
ncbi:MAG TPA: poly-beta-1,6-N-acetyl-D-glucosamine N-deacetylase PgaB [Burkholderiales bacterium]